MKKLLTILTITAVVFAACSKTKKLHKRLATKWNITTKDYQFYYNNVLTPSQTYNVSAKGSIELKSDGTGTISDPTNANGDLVVYTVTDWFNDEGHLSILVKDQNAKVNQLTFDVTGNEAEKQVWYNEFNQATIAGIVQTKTTYTLAIAK